MWRLLIRTVDIWANSEMMSPTENEDTKSRTVIGIKVKVNVLTHTDKYFYDLYMQVGIKRRDEYELPKRCVSIKLTTLIKCHWLSK